MSQCNATIWVRDTYRRTGRGRSGFELHHTKQQCSRRALAGSDYCRQHRDGSYAPIPYRDREGPPLIQQRPTEEGV